jgi:hypothetical protein
MTYGVVAETFGWDRAKWDSMPWHDCRMYLDYLRLTGRLGGDGQPVSTPPPAQVASRSLTTIAEDDYPAPPASPAPVPTEDGDAGRGPALPEFLAPQDSPPSEKTPDWLNLPVRQVAAFGAPAGG